VLDLLGDIGGLNDALFLLFKLLVSSITGSMLYTDLIPSVFHVHRESARAAFTKKIYR
jgi:hypothetical protein